MLSRRRFLSIAGGVLAASVFQNPLAALASRPAGTFTEIRRGVGTYVERGGTIGWLIRDGSTAVVDTQYPETAQNVLTGLAERTSTANGAPIDLLVNTHHHGDHTGGNPTLVPASAASVAHANCPRLQRQAANDGTSVVTAAQTFDDTWSTDLGDETIRLQHDGPAHTGGDATIFFEKANVVHTGDLVFHHVVPFIDVNGGANVQNWITTLETLHDRYDDDTTLIFGHGHPDRGITGDRSGLLQMRDYLTAVSEFVRKKTSEGTSLDDLKKTTDLPGFEEYSSEDWPLPLSQNLEAVYTLQKE